TIPFKGRVNVTCRKIRPVALGKVQLCVGQLPDEEIGNTLLATGTDEQVGLRRKGHGQIRSESSFVDVLRVLGKFGTLHEQALHRLQDIPAPPVVGRNRQVQGIVLRCALFRRLNEFLQARLEGGNITNHTQAYTLVTELADLFFESLHEKPHEQRDLVGRPAPVFGAEGKKGEKLYAAPTTGFDHSPYGLDAAHMPRRAGQKTLGCPAPVAVHNNGEVTRHI